jgi:hypothetical protein
VGIIGADLYSGSAVLNRRGINETLLLLVMASPLTSPMF